MTFYTLFIDYFYRWYSLKPLHADLFNQIHAFFREFDDPTKEFKNVFSAGVMIRVVFNQAVFIGSD